MLILDSQRIYDLVLDKLNANTKQATFSGNFVFKFWQQPSSKIQEFHIIKPSDTLEYEAEEVAPFVDIQTIEIPFNEKNKRSDMELEYYIAIRIPEKVDANGTQVIEFDTENKFYQALLEFVETMKTDLTLTDGTIKASFKTREPQKVNIFKFNANYYQLFALTLNVSKIEQGRFGNEFKLYFGDKNGTLTELDMVETTILMSKVEHDQTKTGDKTNKTGVQQRTWQLQGLCNFRGIAVDKVLMNEIVVSTAYDNLNDKEYDIRLLQTGDFDITRTVRLFNGNVIFKNNKVEQITFTLKS